MDKQQVQDAIDQAGLLGGIAITMIQGEIRNVMVDNICVVGEDRLVIFNHTEGEGREASVSESEILFSNVVAVNAYP
jgi:hypothetical protein